MLNKKRLTAIIIVSVFLIILALIYIFSSRFSYFADVVLQGPYVLFQKPTFDYVLPDDMPPAEGIIGEEGLSAVAAQGEIEPITFSVRANQNLGKTDVTISNLSFENNIISNDNIEIYNIKTWDQCRYKPDSSDCTGSWGHTVEVVPELLVKDNEQNLVAADTGWDEEDKLYTAPEINSTFNLDLPGDKTHTFYIRINTPEDAVAGNYSGKINFSPELVDGEEIALHYEVLPYSLPADGKDRLIYFQQKSIAGDGFHNSQFYMDREMYVKYIDEIKEAGYNGLVLFQSDWNELKWTINLLARKGFSGPIVFASIRRGDIKHMNEHAIDQGLDPYFYGIDEPNINTVLDTRAEDHINAVKAFHDLGVKAYTAIRTECVEAMDDPEFYIYGLEGVASPTQETDLPNYAFSPKGFDCAKEADEHDGPARVSFAEYTESLWNKTIEKRREREHYYHQAWEERGAYNRMVFGFATHRFGLDGTAPYAVMAHYNQSWSVYHEKMVLTQGPSFYDDFDGPRQEHNTLYPGADGPVRTLQWESLREGIDDSRYLTKADILVKELGEKFGKEIADEYSDKIRSAIEKYHFNGLDGITPWNTSKVSSQLVDDTRGEIINLISSMQDTLTNTTAPELLEVNISENQVIATNPFLITAKAVDDIGVRKVEFYVDDNLIGTSTLPDVEGNYQANWDTSLYHSTVRVVAYDINGNQTEKSVNATVQLAQATSDPIVLVLPKTGEESWHKSAIYDVGLFIKQIFDIAR